MEIIVVILLGLVSLLFKKFENRQEETPPSQRPASPNQPSQMPRRLQDYTRELFDEFQDPKERKPKPNTVEVKKPTYPEPKMEPVMERVPFETAPSRASSVRRQPTKKSKQPAAVLPANGQELLQAFIFSEVIGRPKSKR